MEAACDDPIACNLRNMTEIPRIDPIKYLLVSKFGDRGVGVVRDGERATPPELARKIAEYRQYLENLSDYHLSNLFKEEQVRALYDEQQFHRPRADADFEYWARMPHWTVNEAVALTLGKAPEEVNWHTAEKVLDRSSVAAEYSRRRELAVRSVAWKHLTDPVLPAEFVAWADRMGMTIPEALRNALDAEGVKETDYKALYESLLASRAEADESRAAIFQALQKMSANLEAAQAENRASKALGTKERESMTAIIAGMVIGRYKYNPGAEKNSATQQIANDMARIGLRLDVDTVRKYVVEAVRFAKENGEPDF
jgi:Glu-tRNA(Gln) amidotransferase subunit E-like FAD-binding protein